MVASLVACNRAKACCSLVPSKWVVLPVVGRMMGVRALALAERIRATNTGERIVALVAAQRLPADLGTELTESLHFFMRLKLDAGLAALEAERPDAGIVPARLSSLDRDLLKDTLAVVKRVKTLLRQRFHLDAV